MLYIFTIAAGRGAGWRRVQFRSWLLLWRHVWEQRLHLHAWFLLWQLCQLWVPGSCCSLQWRHNERDGVSNHQPRDCLLNHLFWRRSKKTSKLRVIGLCAGNSPVTSEFPAQGANNAENVSIWWRHHVVDLFSLYQHFNLVSSDK